MPADQPSENPAMRRRDWLVALLVLTVAAVLIALSLRGGSKDPPGEQQPAANGSPADGPVATVIEPEQEPLLDLARRQADDPMSAGPADAPVSLVVYSDFQCPFCALWTVQTQPTMLEYAAAGDLRIEWRDIDVFGPESRNAARAAYAAGQQGRYGDYHAALFADGDPRSPGELQEEALIGLAGELGLDTEQFAADLAGEEVAAGVAENMKEAVRLGVFSTPAFILGGEPILGAQPTPVFVEAFEDALARAES